MYSSLNQEWKGVVPFWIVLLLKRYMPIAGVDASGISKPSTTYSNLWFRRFWLFQRGSPPTTIDLCRFIDLALPPCSRRFLLHFIWSLDIETDKFWPSGEKKFRWHIRHAQETQGELPEWQIQRVFFDPQLKSRIRRYEDKCPEVTNIPPWLAKQKPETAWSTGQERRVPLKKQIGQWKSQLRRTSPDQKLKFKEPAISFDYQKWRRWSTNLSRNPRRKKTPR